MLGLHYEVLHPAQAKVEGTINKAHETAADIIIMGPEEKYDLFVIYVTNDKYIYHSMLLSYSNMAGDCITGKSSL